MTPYRKALIALTLATMVAYAVLIGLGSRYLFLGSEGLRPFDLRILGYTYADATTYIALLTPDQAALYVGPLRMLDTVFPILFGLWMGWVQWGITRNIHPWSRVIMLIAPAGFVMMDLAENALIAEMVQTTADTLSEELVLRASSYTISKYVTLAGALLALAALGVRWLRTRPFPARAR